MLVPRSPVAARLAVAVLLVIAPLFAPGAASAPRESGDPRLGVWSDGGDPPIFFEFEPERLHTLEAGRHTFYYARLLEGGVVLWRFMHRERWKTRFEGDELLVRNQERSWRLRRLDERPAGLDLPAVPLGKPDPLESQRVAAIRSELRRRAAEDQAVRTDPSRAGDMQRVDADNTAWLRSLIAEVGWTDVARFGAEASNEAFLVVQHSGDVLLMNTVLPLLEKDVRSGALDPQAFSLLFDRLQLYLGRKQRYGTQIGEDPDNGAPIVFPLEDPEHVEEIRRAIGLFPLKVYLDLMERQTGKRPVFYEWT